MNREGGSVAHTAGHNAVLTVGIEGIHACSCRDSLTRWCFVHNFLRFLFFSVSDVCSPRLAYCNKITGGGGLDVNTSRVYGVSVVFNRE